MSAWDEKVKAVAEYLAGQFDPEMLSSEPHPSGIEFRVKSGEEVFVVTVGREFLDSHSGEEIGLLLLQWNLAGELKKTQGLPMAVSEEGVRLASGA